jgi:hypothetical protein
LSGLATLVSAQLPATRLLAIYPLGARAGTQVEIDLTSGADLEGVHSLLFSHPGITATAKQQEQEGKQVPVPNKFVVTIAADVPPGTYDLRAIGPYGVSNPRLFTVSDRAEQVEAEPNNALAQATAVPLESTVSARCDAARDIDWFRFEAKAGQRVLIESFAQRIDSRTDATLELFDATGRLLATSRDVQQRDALIDFRVPADGSYLVRAFDFTYLGGPEYGYRLSLATAPHIDYLWPPSGVPGTRSTYTIFGRNLPGGTPVEGMSLDGQTLEQLPVEIEIPADDATRLPRQWDLAAAPLSAALDNIGYRLASSVGVSNEAPLWLASGPVVIEQAGNDAVEQAQELNGPCEVAGQFERQGDVDWFRLPVKKGEVFWIEVISQRLGTPSNPYLVVELAQRDEQGKVTSRRLAEGGIDVSQNIGSQSINLRTDDPTTRIEAPEDGELRVMVRDLFGESQGDPSHLYRLVLRRPTPDFRVIAFPEFPLDPANAPHPWTLLVRKGGTDKLNVLVARQDGFDGPIQVSASNLPEGVQCPPITIGPGQNSGTLVLSAAESAADFVGPIQLTAKAPVGDQPLTRPVRAATVTFSGTAAILAESRLARQTVLAVQGAAPFLVEPTLTEVDLAQGKLLHIPVKLTRRGDFTAPVAVTAAGLPAKVQNAAVTIAEGQSEATLTLVVPADVPVGTFSWYLQATAPVPFTKNADGSDKKPVNTLSASLPITTRIAPSPVVLTVNVPNKGAVKKGTPLNVDVQIARRNEFAGPVTLELLLPPGVVGITAPPVTVPADQKQGQLVIQVAAEAADGAPAYVAIRARMDVSGNPIEVEQPFPLTVQP